MPLLKKISFRQKPAKPVPAAGITTTNENVFTREVKYAAPGETASDDDEATLFTTFMVIYYTFFGLVMITYPQAFAASWNPLPYWVSLTEPTCFAFRLGGAAMLTLVLGPFLDDIFGGVGVVMKAFTRQMLLLNLLIFVLFIYYGFYAPMDTQVTMMFQAQAIVCALVLGWNIVEAMALETVVSYYCLFNVMEYSFFGIFLVAYPQLFSGESLIAYWTEYDALGLLTGMGLGVSLICFFILGYYYYGDSFCKSVTILNTLNLVLFIMCAYFGGSMSVDKMWEVQVGVTVPLVFVGLYLEAVGATGPWSFSMPCPAWGMNIETFNFVNFFWFLPFVLGFYYDPNLLFGPANPLGFPMFLIDFNEVSLWFVRAWVTNMLVIILGPYLFGLSPIKIAKQFVFLYFFYTCMFVYFLFTSTLLNTIIVAPITAFNFLFFAWGLYLVLPAQSGEPLL